MDVCAFILFVLFFVWVVALQWADPLLKESCQLCIDKKLKKQQRSKEGL
jgi:hypothetical protein